MFLISFFLVAAGLSGLFFPEYIISNPKSYSPFIFIFITISGIYLMSRCYKKTFKEKDD